MNTRGIPFGIIEVINVEVSVFLHKTTNMDEVGQIVAKRGIVDHKTWKADKDSRVETYDNEEAGNAITTLTRIGVGVTINGGIDEDGDNRMYFRKVLLLLQEEKTD